MERVTGIAGLFFRAKNPAALAQWYQQHLGIDLGPTDCSQKPWSQEAAPTVFAPRANDTDYLGNNGAQAESDHGTIRRRHWTATSSENRQRRDRRRLEATRVARLCM